MRELSTYEQTVVDTADEFGKTVISPNAQSWNKQGRVPEAAFKQAAALGLCRLLVPESLGGLALSVSALAAVMRSLAKHCFASTFSFVVHNNLAANIARNASETLRNAVLPAMMQGSRVGAFLLTEPQGGSDAFDFCESRFDRRLIRHDQQRDSGLFKLLDRFGGSGFGRSNDQRRGQRQYAFSGKSSVISDFGQLVYCIRV